MSRLSLALKAMTIGSEPQSFLDATWIPPLIQSAPHRWRRRVALSVLAWSPHYFYHRPEHRGLSRAAFLEREFARNRETRRALCDRILAPHLRQSDAVLDYGCGAGFLAYHVARRVRSVIGVDIARGALACARVLNATGGTRFLHTAQIATVPDASVDVVCSFAVFQHMTDAALAGALATARRVLRPGGRLVAHIVIDGHGWRTEDDWRRNTSVVGRLNLRYGLNCFSRSDATVRALLTTAGFKHVEVRSLSDDFPEPFDDICAQHLVVAR